MSEPHPEPDAQPALVLERWNSWVKLYFPASGGSGWVNLGEVEYELLDGPPPGHGIGESARLRSCDSER